jgi:hypothetical protein
VPLVAGHAYRIQFIVRAEAGVTVPLVFQQSDEPHEIYSSYDIDAGPVARTYSFDYRPGQDAEDVAFSFFLGAAGSMQFWFDEVSAVERVSTGTRTEREDAGSASGSMLLGVYPNPMRSAGNVSFSLPEQSLVVMAVFDVLGRRVLSAPSEWYEAGDHRSTLDVSQLPAGVYVLCLDSGAYRRSETFAVLGAGASVR